METTTLTKKATLVHRAYDLMEETGLIAEGWKLGFNANKSHAGSCNHTKKVISLSRFYFEHGTEESSWDTITHEVAHAVVGGGHGHDRTWRLKHIELGGSGERTFTVKGALQEEYRKASKWVGRCPANEGHTVYRNRLTQKSRTSSCSRCSYRYDPKLVFVWKQNY